MYTLENADNVERALTVICHRFSGALCGLVYTFMLPSIVYLMIRRQQVTLNITVICVHVAIVIIGVLNFVAQFLII